MSAVRPSRMIKLYDMPSQVLLGLSGGADSVALLLLLLDAGVQVCAVHVNHGLRGEESDADEAFVRKLCGEKNVPLLTYRARPPENPGEGWAREARYGFFHKAMEETGIFYLMLAHHQDDQAETLLLHLLRGTGMAGLTGMSERTVVDGLYIRRPLLRFSRAELRAYLNEKGQPWREDSSNSDSRYLRNALRQSILPQLEALAPGVSARMAATAVILQEEDAALDLFTEEFLEDYPGKELPLAELEGIPDGLQKRILRAWWERAAAPQEERSLSFSQTQLLHSMLHAPVSCGCNLPGEWRGRRGWTHLHLVPPTERVCIPEMPAEQCPLIEIAPCDGFPGDGASCQVIPREWLAECTVRSRRRGDYIRPFGAKGKQSLQDYFVNRRIDTPFRDRVPLLCRDSEVLLAGGVGAGNIPRMNEIQDAVLLRWRENFPWQRTKNNEEHES